mmetsp:Transcript_7971/g.13373  ORF Transcript_7971/g.13373 Transcript_7971/m.13373 type:complete len:98 (+) Transcript_7971:4-297(+)
MDFLDPNNDCGQSILKLVAAGSSILAELLRLQNHIPDVFLFESSKHNEFNLMTGQEKSEDEKKKESASKNEKGTKKKDKKQPVTISQTEQAQKQLEA